MNKSALLGLLITAAIVTAVFLFVRSEPRDAPVSPVGTPAPQANVPAPRETTAPPPDPRANESARVTPPDAQTARETLPASAVRNATGGWNASGRVTGRPADAASGAPDAPVPGASVDLWLVLADGTRSLLARTRSAEDGTFAASLEPVDALGPLRLVAASVVARVQGPGFQPGATARALDGGAAQRAITADVRLVPGHTLRGRAVDANGKPVPEAQASLSIADERAGPAGRALLFETQADADGAFALGFASKARVMLLVRADGAGVHWAEIDLEARDHDAGDVELTGGPPLAGRATYVDDEPAPHIELWAIESSTAFQPDAFETAVRRARIIETETGLSWSKTRTDAAGHFEFRGLRPDHYAILSADSAIVLEPRQGRWEPGQTNVEIQVQTPLLVVRVTDAAGVPAPGAVIEATDLGVEADGTFLAGGTRRAVARGPLAAATFSADPETPMALRARARGAQSEERVVYFGQGTLHLEHVLVLAPRGAEGRLRLSLADAAAGEVTYRAAIASLATGQRDEDVGLLEAGADGLITGVPPGEHRLELDFGGTGGQWFFPWRSSDPVRVTSGEETRVLVTPEVGARLAVSVSLSGPPPPGLGDPAASPAAASLQRDRYGVRVSITPAAGGSERALPLRVGGEGVVALLPGEVAEVDVLLAPGDYVLGTGGTRWMHVKTPVRLVAGRRLEAHADVGVR